MRTRHIAAGINASIIDTVGEMAAQKIAVQSSPTARVGDSMTALRTRIQLLVKHLAAGLVECHDGLPRLGILRPLTKLTRFLHDPGEVQSMCVSVQYASGSIPKRFLSISGIGNVVHVPVSILEIDSRGIRRQTIESPQLL